jgi:hypothetical protein
MSGHLIQLGVMNTLADKLAPEGATLAWQEDLGFDLDKSPRWVDVEFSKRAFTAVVAAEGKSVTQVVTLTGAEIHKMLMEAGKLDANVIVGAAFSKHYFFQFA